MKLSLTAIAALFAATLHPSLAAGTRAASSNINTNAAEAKPDRDLDIMEDLSESLGYVVGDNLKAGLLADGLGDALQVKYLTQCFMHAFAQQVGVGFGIWMDSHSVAWLYLGNNESIWGMLQEIANEHSVVTETSLYWFLTDLSEVKRALMVSTMGDLCAIPVHFANGLGGLH